MGEILEGKISQILSKFVETNMKKLKILCIYENKSLKSLAFWPFAKIKPENWKILKLTFAISGRFHKTFL